MAVYLSKMAAKWLGLSIALFDYHFSLIRILNSYISPVWSYKKKYCFIFCVFIANHEL